MSKVSTKVTPATATATATATAPTEKVKISAALKQAFQAALKAGQAIVIAQRASESAWKTLGKKLREEFPDKEQAQSALKQMFVEHLTDVEKLDADAIKHKMLATSRDRSNVLTFAFPQVPETEVERQLALAESKGTKIRVQDELSIRRANAKINKKGELVKLNDTYVNQNRSKETPATTFAAKLREACKGALLSQIDEKDALSIFKNILKDTYHVEIGRAHV